MNLRRTSFTRKCGELLRAAKPNLIGCELMPGRELPENPTGTIYCPDDEYVLVTFKNGATYVLPVEGNSLCGIAAEIFTKMSHK